MLDEKVAVVNQVLSDYILFEDIEDRNLRCRNQATTITNIMEDNLHPNGTVTDRGRDLTEIYFMAIPEDDRAVVQAQVMANLIKRGMLH